MKNKTIEQLCNMHDKALEEMTASLEVLEAAAATAYESHITENIMAHVDALNLENPEALKAHITAYANSLLEFHIDKEMDTFKEKLGDFIERYGEKP